MMKVQAYLWMILGGMAGVATAQMPTGGGNNGGNGNGGAGVGAVNMPSSFDASGSAVKPQRVDPAHRGETPNPQLLGMEVPLLDPSTDTMSYNGGHFDVGNNAAVRAKFETYLHQSPDDSAESKRYRKLIDEMIKELQKGGRDGRYVIGSGVLVNVGRNLYAADKYPGDGGQSGTLASTMVSVLDALRSNRKRDQQNEKLDAEVDELLRETNVWNNQNERRREVISRYNNAPASTPSNSKKGGGGKSGGSGPSAMLNMSKIGHHVEKMGEAKTQKAGNVAANEAALAAAKINYQSLLITMLLSRRFDHAVIGARVYRHLFADGDTRLKLNKDSKANEMFGKGVGMPPTINAVDSLASNARRQVDQNIEAVHSMLAQGRLGQATQHLIEAVAIGEYMQSVATFPTEARMRVAEYWNLRKDALVALNARDYEKVENISKRMSELDRDYNDSMLRSYVTAKKNQSNFAIRNAQKAMLAGNEEAFQNYIEEATIVWPLNPNLNAAAEKLAEIDNGDPIKEEFKTLYAEKAYRTITTRKDRYKIVALDPELAKQYEEAITLVMKMDGILEQLQTASQQDVKLGPCAAYEKMLELQKEDERYAQDEKMQIVLKDFESRAHSFVQALREAEVSFERREFGSSLSSFYRAQCIFPQSKLASEGIRRAMNVIVNATYN